MSSSLETYFVVKYDHTDGKFYVDSDTAEARFRHDTWDDDEGEWVYLDQVLDSVEELPNLTSRLNKIIREGQEK
jgi:hypothetical protein